jgi:hypothetical protein
MNLIAISALTLLLHSKFAIAGLNENERIEEYYRRGNTWPPAENDFKPPTKGWKQLNKRRFKQLEYLEDNNRKRYEGYMQSVYSALISKNFTEYGWGVTRAPQAVIDKLKKRLNDGMKNDKYDFEHETDVIETESRPLFFRDQVMNREIVEEMLPLHEAWSGVELVPNNAYGLRVYRNDTNLNMHLDKKETHVISSILHVDHGENDDPWPIVIEDFHGNTNEVFLESGDMLFYESSKLVHGRPKKMNGEYYSSLFSHYYPKDWDPKKVEEDVHFRIPGHWSVAPTEDDANTDKLIMVDTSMKEPDCENAWCGLKDTIKWYGPGPGYGKVLSGLGIVKNLVGIPPQESFEKHVQDVDTDDDYYYFEIDDDDDDYNEASYDNDDDDDEIYDDDDDDGGRGEL